jgi:hypothetical protein
MAVEAAIVLPAFLLLVFAAFDYGLAVFRYNSLSECARRSARLAMTRGDRSRDPLGPATWSGTAAETSPLTDCIRPLLITMAPELVEVHSSWPDGDDRVGQCVRVELRYEHTPFFSFLSGSGSWDLAAASTMEITY